MYFDAKRNAYIDRETGEVIFQEEEAVYDFPPVVYDSPANMRSSRSFISNGGSDSIDRAESAANVNYQSVYGNELGSTSQEYYFVHPTAGVSPTVISGRAQSFTPISPVPGGTLASRPASSASLTPITGSNRSIRYEAVSGKSPAPASGLTDLELIQFQLAERSRSNISLAAPQNDLEEDLYNIHLNNNYDIIEPTETERQTNPSGWDDWNFARTLQVLEFEIDDNMMNGFDDRDFNAKEYRASKSCRRQLMTISFFICIVQIAILIAMCEMDGIAPNSENSVIGPPAYSMVRFGAKESSLIVYKNEYWRLLSCTMLHAGVFHIVPNVAIQLRVGGYLNLIYGTPKWLFIYFASGIFGSLMSCCFLPDQVGVGSSGALMGMLASWIAWILFRWKKIPPECRMQRNCQLFTVVAAIAVTLATSFMPAVDYAAHAGGAFQGFLWGFILLGNEIESTHNQIVSRVIAAIIALVTYAIAFYYVAVRLKPSKDNMSYWAANDDWR